MGTKTEVIFVDDLDDAVEAAETITFAYRGTTYEIDLSKEHAAEFDDDTARYRDAARIIVGKAANPVKAKGVTVAAATGLSQSQKRAANKAIRQWAADNGWEIAERGAIPAAVVEAYETALAKKKR